MKTLLRLFIMAMLVAGFAKDAMSQYGIIFLQFGKNENKN